VICSFCDKKFAEADAQKACQACSMFGGCKKVKCPYCGYEQPPVPAFLEKIVEIQKKIWRDSNDR
jgi:hypothetical protein